MTTFQIIGRDVAYDIYLMSHLVRWNLVLNTTGEHYAVGEVYPDSGSENVQHLPMLPQKKFGYRFRYSRSSKGQYRYRWAWANIQNNSETKI